MSSVEILQALVITFSAVFLMEMGDKTQLTAFTLSMKYQSPIKVFLGVITGLTGVTILAVIGGMILKSTLDLEILKPLIVLFFLGVGLIILVTEIQNRKEDASRICPVSLDLCDKPKENCPEMGKCELYLNAEVRKGAFIRSTAFMFLAELGDKTMLMGLGLATQFDPLGVFIGAIIALSVVNAIGVFVGDRIARKLPITILGIISGFLFLITGFFILIF